MSKLDDLAVRAARAELERDAAIERAEKAERAWRSLASSDKHLIETLNVIGIPAKDLRDIYRIDAAWRAAGGNNTLLEFIRAHTSLLA